MGEYDGDSPVQDGRGTVSKGFGQFATLGALVEVFTNGLGALGRNFAVKQGHDFFRSCEMRFGDHARCPFGATIWGLPLAEPAAATTWFAASEGDGFSNSRRAVRARNRRERTLLIGRWRRSAISA